MSVIQQVSPEYAGKHLIPFHMLIDIAHSDPLATKCQHF